MKPAKKRGAQDQDKNCEPMVVESTNLVPIKGGASVEVLTADETYANSVHLQIMGLLKKYQETYFELARSLFDVSVRRLYRQMDEKYPSFQAYVEEAVGIDFRKAKYLVSIWWWYGVEQGADPRLLQGAQEIGWSKAKELVEVVDKKNADRWFGLAKSLNKGDLAKAARAALKKAGKTRNRRRAPESVFQGDFEFKDESLPIVPVVIDETGTEIKDESKLESTDEVEDEKQTPKGMRVLTPKHPKGAVPAQPQPPEGVDIGGDQPPSETEEALEGVAPPEDVEDAVAEETAKSKEWTRMYFDVHKDFKQTVGVAVDNAKQSGETEHAGYALSLICLHYLSFYSKKWSVEIGEWLRRIEQVTGLTLVAINEKTDEIMYGGDFLDRLAGNDSEEESSADKSGDGDAGDGVGEEGTGGVDS